MGDAQEQAQRLAGELEQRGARNVDVQGDLAVDAFDSTTDEDSGTGTTLFGHEAEIEAVYDGDPEWVRNAVSALPRLVVQTVQDEQWPGGDTRVTAEIRLEKPPSAGITPGGNADDSRSTEGVPPPEGESGPEWTYYGQPEGRTEDSG